jgi:hypothetical protein
MLIDAEFVEKLCTENEAGVGIAVIGDGQIQIDKSTKVHSSSEFQKVQEAFKDYHLLCHFISSDEPISETDIQPTILLDTGGDKPEPLLIAFAEGSFVAYEPKAGTVDVPAATKLMDTFIKPSIDALSGKHQGDIDQIMEYLKTDASRGIILQGALPKTEQGTVAFVDDQGETVVYARNDEHKHYDWGWASREYAEEPMDEVEQATEEAAAAQAVAEAPKKEMPRLAGFRSPTSTPANRAAAEAANTAKVSPATAPSAIGETSEVIYVGPPDAIQGKNALRAFYKRILGRVPKNFKDRPYVPVNKTREEKIKLSGAIIHQTNPDRKAPANPNSNKETLKTTTAPPPAPKPEPAKASVPTTGSVAAPTTTLSAATKTSLKAFLEGGEVKKHLDTNSTVIIDPERAQALEGKIIPFHEQMGLPSLAATYYMPFVDLVGIAKHGSIDALALLAMNYRTELINTRKQMLTLTDKKVEVAEQKAETVAAETAKHVEGVQRLKLARRRAA